MFTKYVPHMTGHMSNQLFLPLDKKHGQSTDMFFKKKKDLPVLLSFAHDFWFKILFPSLFSATVLSLAFPKSL